MVPSNTAEASRQAGAACRLDVVRVFEHEPELLDGVDEETVALLRRRVLAPEPFAEPCSWRVLRPATLAVLDERFAALAGCRPSIIAALLARSTRRARWLGLHLAIAQARQAEARLPMLFWHLAGRWGRMTPEGVALPLPLTHALLADLVCLHRPTTSTALQRLTRAGEIARRRDRGWLL